MEKKSAFVRRIIQHLTPTNKEWAAIDKMESMSETLLKKDLLFDRAHRQYNIAIVRSGWVSTRIHGGSQKSTIAQIYTAGDIIGLAELGIHNNDYEFRMQTDGTINLISKETLKTLLLSYPRIFALMVAISNLDTLSLTDRMHTITRLDATDRMMNFLLSMRAKSNQNTDIKCSQFLVPFTQAELGDILGLTDIYVNRLTSSFRRSGDLTVNRPYVKITDPDAWAEKVKFRERNIESVL